jgi:hypothetical protein
MQAGPGGGQAPPAIGLRSSDALDPGRQTGHRPQWLERSVGDGCPDASISNELSVLLAVFET